MIFLLDSNVAIKSDPLSTEVEDDYDLAMRFQRLAASGQHGLLVHPSSMHDFDRDPDVERREVRKRSIARYDEITAPPPRTPAQEALYGSVVPRSNDAVDLDLLACVAADAVDFLVTQDDRIHRKAARLGVSARVLRLPDAIAVIESLFVRLPQPPPAVERCKAHELDLGDPIWASLRVDYPGFDLWLGKVRREQRDALLVRASGSALAAVCLLKQETGGEHGMTGPLLKISTFKVDPARSGYKYGELLLKAVFDQCAAEGQRGVYVTAFARHVALVEVLGDFGFDPLPQMTALGEQVLYKSLVWTDPEREGTDALEFHRRFGPPALKIDGTTPHLVPIEPRWHRLLFPDAEPAYHDQQTLFPVTAALETYPFGNALRKAYLCHAPTRRLQPGDPLLFYRSTDERAVFVVGVCESLHASRSADHIAALVGQRTVYTYNDIRQQVRHNEVLVVLFRQARVMRSDPITLDDLIREGIARAWPQTIQQARLEGLAWLRQRLAA